jgi:hypothetical protein
LSLAAIFTGVLAHHSHLPSFEAKVCEMWENFSECTQSKEVKLNLWLVPLKTLGRFGLTTEQLSSLGQSTEAQW